MGNYLQQPVSRLWLESLSTGELIKLADNYGVDIPPGLERIFIIEEILECSQIDFENTNGKVKEEIVVNPSYSESVLLPKKYNISYIEVIIRDPLWVFVLWEIKSHDRDIHENAHDFNGYFLRVIPLNEGKTEQQIKESSFTVSVAPDDSARYLGFAEHSSNPVSSMNCDRYQIKLGVQRGDSELQIASSLPFNLPKLYENDVIAELSFNPLIRLSGINDLLITKKTDRKARVKRETL